MLAHLVSAMLGLSVCFVLSIDFGFQQESFCSVNTAPTIPLWLFKGMTQQKTKLETDFEQISEANA